MLASFLWLGGEFLHEHLEEVACRLALLRVFVNLDHTGDLADGLPAGFVHLSERLLLVRFECSAEVLNDVKQNLGALNTIDVVDLALTHLMG